MAKQAGKKSVRTGARARVQQHTYDALRRMLQMGQLVPGQSITVREIAERLDTSPMPVREAFRRLVAERSLQLLPNGSVRVRLMTDEERSEAREIRSMLESYAVALAAKHITAEELAEARRQDAAMQEGIDQRDPRQVSNANRAFHFVLYKAARAPILLETIDSLWVQNAPFIALYIMQVLAHNDPAGLRLLNQHHEPMLQALEHGEGGKAAELMRIDLGQTSITHEMQQSGFLQMALKTIGAKS